MNHRWLAAAALASLLRCGSRDPGNPNGKLGVLFFDEECNPIGLGLSEQVLVPKHVVLGGGPKSTDRTKTFDYDFAGTTLEATGANGLTILGADLVDTGWAVRIRCDAAVNVPSELHVRVMAGVTVRYEDAYDVTCRGPGLLSIVTPATPAQVAIGARIVVEQRLALASGQKLYGHGVGISDPSGPLTVESAQTDFTNANLWLVAMHAGSGAILQAGPATVEVPVTVLGDASWSVAVTATRSGASTVSYSVRLADTGGASLDGTYDCAVTATVGGTSATGSACQGTLDLGAGSGTLCATVLGKTACAAIVP